MCAYQHTGRFGYCAGLAADGPMLVSSSALVEEASQLVSKAKSA